MYGTAVLAGLQHSLRHVELLGARSPNRSPRSRGRFVAPCRWSAAWVAGCTFPVGTRNRSIGFRAGRVRSRGRITGRTALPLRPCCYRCPCRSPISRWSVFGARRKLPFPAGSHAAGGRVRSHCSTSDRRNPTDFCVSLIGGGKLLSGDRLSLQTVVLDNATI